MYWNSASMRLGAVSSASVPSKFIGLTTSARRRVAAAATGLRTGAAPRARRDQERRGGERGENEGGGSTHHCTGMGTSQTSKLGVDGSMWWTGANMRFGAVSSAIVPL